MDTSKTTDPGTETAYDWIYLADNEWGNNVMRQVAEEHFAAHPEVQFVWVKEHSGWHLGYRRDGSIWNTANDAAVLEKPKPQPTGWSGRLIRRDPAERSVAAA